VCINYEYGRRKATKTAQDEIVTLEPCPMARIQQVVSLWFFFPCTFLGESPSVCLRSARGSVESAVCVCLPFWTVLWQKGMQNYVSFGFFSFKFCFSLSCHSATLVELVEAAPPFFIYYCLYI
jgi:hypothetical protein